MISVTAALIRRGDTILIAQRKESAFLAGHWEFPGGKIEEGESPEECLARELLEELGVDATVHRLFAENTYEYKHGVVRLLAFAASVDDFASVRLIDHARIEWVIPENRLSYKLAPADVAIAKEVVSRFHELQ